MHTLEAGQTFTASQRAVVLQHPRLGVWADDREPGFARYLENPHGMRKSVILAKLRRVDTRLYLDELRRGMRQRPSLFLATEIKRVKKFLREGQVVKEYRRNPMKIPWVALAVVGGLLLLGKYRADATTSTVDPALRPSLSDWVRTRIMSAGGILEDWEL